MPLGQGQLVHKDRTEGTTAGGYQAVRGHLAMALEEPFELLIEILNSARAGFRQAPADFYPVIGVWVCPSCGRAHKATAPRTPLLQVGIAIMLVSQQKAEFQGPCLEQARSLQVIGSSGGGEFCREGNPDARRRADQRQFPAIHPAGPARFGPVGFGINRGMRDAAGLPGFLVPDAPRARNTVLSMSAARAQSVQGWSRATKWRPRHPSWAGKVAGSAARRRAQVRRLGRRPWGAVSSPRRSCISGVGSASTAKNSFTLCKRRTIMMTKAFRKSRSGYTGGRPRPRGDGAGMGIRSTGLTKVTSKDSCSNLGHLRTRWLGEPLCYGGSRARESSGAAQNYDQASSICDQRDRPNVLVQVQGIIAV
jgi:hypothetical protein